MPVWVINKQTNNQRNKQPILIEAQLLGNDKRAAFCASVKAQTLYSAHKNEFNLWAIIECAPNDTNNVIDIHVKICTA